jgi:hypothetical protein
MAYFTKEGYTVSIPLTDSQDYDLIVDNGILQRVQIKTTSYKNKQGSFTISLTIKGGNQSWGGVCKKFDKSKVDALFVLTNEGDQYFIPCSAFNCVNSLAVSKKYIKYKVS